jgi:hypothetical protein
LWTQDAASSSCNAPPLRTLAERYPVAGLADAFALGIMTGHPGMPEFRLSRAQIEAVVAYLESIQTRQGAGLRTTPSGPLARTSVGAIGGGTDVERNSLDGENWPFSDSLLPIASGSE